ncbi:MAG: winged helix-turn-helix transcriptional regulator [Acidimicrobiia bacterium]
MAGYGQFCPVAVAAEVFTERWTPLIVRDLLDGPARFNDLRRGLPLISPSLLSKRLRMLERVGVVERQTGAGGRSEYRLTEAGEELGPIVEALGAWGQRWARGDVRPEHLDASLLMWDIHFRVSPEAVPAGRVVVSFHLEGSTDGKSRFWLILNDGKADLCLMDPGHEVDVAVEAHVGAMVRYWLGDTTFADLVRTGELRLSGSRRLVRALPSWFLRSSFAAVPRPRT